MTKLGADDQHRSSAMRLLSRLRRAAASRWAAFVWDPWTRRSALSPFDYDWLTD